MRNGSHLGGGPEVPVDSSLRLVFQRCLLDLMFLYPPTKWKMDDGILSDCKPTVWLDVVEQFTSDRLSAGVLERALYIIVHNNVSHLCGPMQNTH